jgi:hypothetical protein
MKKIKWTKVIFIAGVTALLIGTLDPLEGSVVIAGGSLLITLAAYLTSDRHRKLYLLSTILIAIGVFFLFYLSSRGGFGGNSGKSWWWGLLVSPYLIGWIITIVLLIIRLTKGKKQNQVN